MSEPLCPRDEGTCLHERCRGARCECGRCSCARCTALSARLRAELEAERAAARRRNGPRSALTGDVWGEE